ncbi:DMT family transporter [Actinocorallia populi]|uniref:DMT family transporter n=1 Tax=Actinocorallia populi TaxID=2079200 RepID=UPI000D086B74|nr:SMR family transporter [Actinocorallia populi]
MKKWLPLLAAILLEVAATLSLRAALDAPAWYVVVAIGYLGAFASLSSGLRAGLGIGVAYGVWAASGVALTAVLATAIFGDPLTVTMGLGIVLVIAGVLCVELGSQHAPRPEEGERA